MIPYSTLWFVHSIADCLNQTLHGGTYLYILYTMYGIERFSHDLEKWFRKVFVICLISQWMKRSKHGLFVFPPKKTLIWRRHCLIGQSCCSMKSNWSIDWFLESSFGMKFFQPSVHLTNWKPCTFVSIQQTYQIALFPFVLCFFFCTVHLIYIFSAVLTLVTV